MKMYVVRWKSCWGLCAWQGNLLWVTVIVWELRNLGLIRPVKIIFHSTDAASRVLRNSAALKNQTCYSRVYIIPDRSPQERAKRRTLVTVMKEKIVSEPQRYHFIKDGVVCSRDRAPPEMQISRNRLQCLLRIQPPLWQCDSSPSQSSLNTRIDSNPSQSSLNTRTSSPSQHSSIWKPVTCRSRIISGCNSCGGEKRTQQLALFFWFIYLSCGVFVLSLLYVSVWDSGNEAITWWMVVDKTGQSLISESNSSLPCCSRKQT